MLFEQEIQAEPATRRENGIPGFRACPAEVSLPWNLRWSRWPESDTPKVFGQCGSSPA
jgi:hypothetical protein